MPAIDAVADAAPDSDRPGVNLHGYLSRWLGLGECARLFARALLQEGYPVTLRDVDIDIPHPSRDKTLAAHLGQPARSGPDLVFVNPDHWSDALRSIDPSGTRKNYVIGYWFLELEQFPATWLQRLDHVDEIMVSTAYVERIVRSVCNKPVTRVPVPMLPVHDSGLQRQDFGLSVLDFIFLCTFDFNSTPARKNPYGAIEAFLHAFPRGDERACLLIKSSNGSGFPDQLMQLVEFAGSDSRIVIRDDMLEREDLQALLRCCDAYVSLHRCEGFGLGMAEAMCQGKPVVATGYSGNMEFMAERNSCLVAYRMIPARDGEYPGCEGQQWADPDVEHAAQYMLRLYSERDWGRRLGAQAKTDAQRMFSPRACVRALEHRLAEIERAACAAS